MVDIKALVPWKSTKSQTPATREDFFDPFVTFRRAGSATGAGRMADTHPRCRHRRDR